MSEVRSWNDTAAALIANGGWEPGNDFAEREAEWRVARAEFDARVAADPQWSAARQLQQALADRGWTGSWVNVGPSRPAELDPLFMQQKVGEARTATWGPGADGGMTPTNDFAIEVEEHQRQRAETARLRRQVEDRTLPPGSPR